MKKLITYFVVLMALSLPSLTMEREESISLLDNPSHSQQECIDLAEWFEREYSSNYCGHFNCRYYTVKPCKCDKCYGTKDQKGYYILLRSDDKDADIEHNKEPAKYMSSEEYPTFSYKKQWQYLKEDIIAVSQNPSADNMIKFKGFLFLEFVGNENASRAQKSLRDAINGETITYSGKVLGLPEDWRFQFANPNQKLGPSTFSTFQYLSTLRKLKDAGCSADKYMATAITLLRSLSQTIDSSNVDINGHQEFFCSLVLFNCSSSVEFKKHNQEMVHKACALYKGITSRNPNKALELRGYLNPDKFKLYYPFNDKGPFDDQTWRESCMLSLQDVTYQVQIATINMTLFSGQEGAAYITQELLALKDHFVVLLQKKYNYVYELQNAFHQ